MWPAQGLRRLPEDRALPWLHAGLSLPLLLLREEMLWAALRMGRCLRLGALYPARAERRAGLLSYSAASLSSSQRESAASSIVSASTQRSPSGPPSDFPQGCVAVAEHRQ